MVMVASEAFGAAALMVVKSVVPNVVKKSAMPSERPMSPTRLTMKAFLAAAAAECLYCQKPISRYDARPTPSQPEEQHEVVGRQHQRQHRGDEQVEVAEEAAAGGRRAPCSRSSRCGSATADAGDQQQEERSRAGRRSRSKLTCRPPASNQVNRCWPTCRSSELRPSMVTNMATLSRNDSSGSAVPIRCAVLVETALGHRTTDQQDHGAQRGQRDHQPQQGEDAVGRSGVHDGSHALSENEHRVSLLSTSAGSRRRPRPTGGCGRSS